MQNEFGSMDNLYKEVLGDFFRHAFDGSGADNFFDAGSCIDGEPDVGFGLWAILTNLQAV